MHFIGSGTFFLHIREALYSHCTVFNSCKWVIEDAIFPTPVSKVDVNPYK